MIRLLLLLTFLFTLVPQSGSGHRGRAGVPGDLSLIREVALRDANTPPGAALHFLRAQRRVAAAVMGRDGATIDVRFRDGFHAMLLSRGRRTAPPSPASIHIAPHVLHRYFQGARRALVLEPFATELNLGPDAGSSIVSVLRAAGFAIDRLSNEAVTVQTMSTLSRYNVVYIDTHSGVNQYGEGVVATGQVYNADPTLDAMAKQNTVFAVGVAGSPLIYYGILSAYIRTYESQFPPNALVFMNGCDMLRATLFWQALQSKGVGAMTSWDQEVLPADADGAATVFLNAMAQGHTVQEAMNAVVAANLNVSTVSGQPQAHFGFLGDGLVRLDGSSGSVATATPLPATATPTVGATATPPASPLPPVSLSTSLTHRVRPGARQIFHVTAAPNTTVHISVQYPNGDRRVAAVPTDDQGNAAYGYQQPASRISRYSNTARVTVTAIGNAGTVHNMHRTYQIAFSDVDVVAAPRTLSGRHRIDLWVHTLPNGPVDLSIAGRVLHLTRTLDGTQAGWKHAWLVVPSVTHGPAALEHVQAALHAGARTLMARTSFTVRATVPGS